MQAGIIIVFGLAAGCLGSPISEKLKNEGTSCSVACLKKKLNPVCGTDGRTYKNPCMLNAQNCGSPITVVQELYEGVCSSEPTAERCGKIVDKSISCPEKVDPLCGEDRHTYLSYCQLLQLNCEQKVGIGIVHRGACDAEHRAEAATPEVTTKVGETFVTEPEKQAADNVSKDDVIVTETIAVASPAADIGTEAAAVSVAA